MTLKDLWRPVETGDADKMEFCRGGQKRFVWMGCFYLAIGLLLAALFLQFLGISYWNSLLDALRFKMYRAAIGSYILGSFFSLFFLKYFFLGIWMIFGRTRVVLDRKTLSIIKEERLRSFCFFSKDFQIGSSSALSFRRKPRFFAPLHYVWLNDEKNRWRRILVLPRNFAGDGWLMAEQMARFFGIPLLDKTSSA
jgi:hypothetical protein